MHAVGLGALVEAVGFNLPPPDPSGNAIDMIVQSGSSGPQASTAPASLPSAVASDETPAPSPTPSPPVPSPPVPSPPASALEQPVRAAKPPSPAPMARPAAPPSAKPVVSASPSAGTRAAKPQTAAATVAGEAVAANVGPARLATGPSPLIPARPVEGVAGHCQPPYPAAAQRRLEQGTVVLRVAVAPDGSAAGVTIVQSSGHAMLDDAALAKVLHECRFVPATRDGAPQAGIVLLPFTFALRN